MLKKTETLLKCILGQCNHTALSKDCLFNKICDAKDPDAEELKQLKKVLEAEIKYCIMQDRTQRAKKQAVKKVSSSNTATKTVTKKTTIKTTKKTTAKKVSEKKNAKK